MFAPLLYASKGAEAPEQVGRPGYGNMGKALSHGKGCEGPEMGLWGRAWWQGRLFYRKRAAYAFMQAAPFSFPTICFIFQSPHAMIAGPGEAELWNDGFRQRPGI